MPWPQAQYELLEARALMAVTSITVNAIDPIEGESFGSAASPAPIGSFVVNNYIGVDESSQYSASIKWGDGTESAGLGPVTVTFLADLGNGNASYAVKSYHTYADATTTANPYSLTITVADNTGPGTLQSQSGPVFVRNQALSSTLPAGTINATLGVPLTNLTVGRFIDANPLATANDYAVQVAWGDGTTSAGTVVPYRTAVQLGGTGVEFSVEASHAYTSTGNFSILTTINDFAGASVTETLPVIVTGAGLQQATGAPVHAVEGIPFTGTVASLVDPNPGDTAANLTATINWGNGDSTSGSVVANGTSAYLVTAVDPVSGKGYAYPEEGTYTISVTVKSTSGVQTTVFSTATVADAPLTATGVTVVLPPSANALFSGQIATFTDANPNGTLSDFTSSIDWGDGAVSRGIISLSATTPGVFVVSGTHQYAPSSIPYQATISITDQGGASATAVSSITAFVPLSISGRLNPSSDSGASSSDAITNVVRPNFFGTTSQPGSTVTLYAQQLGGGAPFVIGQAGADSSGSWSITANQVLSDGGYAITAVASNGAGNISSDTTSITPNLVIDTAGPKITGVYFNRFVGQIQYGIQDFGGPGGAGVGVIQSTLADANNYAFSRARAGGLYKVNVISVVPGTTTGQQVATLTINQGTNIKGGRYGLTIRSVTPNNLSGIQDIAGNALDGEFYGYLPSGNNHVGGDFVAELDAKHQTIYPPATRVGSASPVVPPGTPAQSNPLAGVAKARVSGNRPLALVASRMSRRIGAASAARKV